MANPSHVWLKNKKIKKWHVKKAIKDISWIQTSVLTHHYLMVIYIHTQKNMCKVLFSSLLDVMIEMNLTLLCNTISLSVYVSIFSGVTPL